MKICLQLAWKNFGNEDKNNKMNNGNEKHPKKVKVKLLYDFLWNKFVQKFPQTIKRLLNIATVAQYLFKLTGIFKYQI